MTGASATLQRELQTYRDKLHELAADEGKYALVAGDDVVGVFTSYEDALAAGYQRQGMAPFLVRKISAVEHVAQFTRDLTCRT